MKRPIARNPESGRFPGGTPPAAQTVGTQGAIGGMLPSMPLLREDEREQIRAAIGRLRKRAAEVLGRQPISAGTH